MVGSGSADWIVEQPSQSGGCRDPLARYGQVVFTDAACGTGVSTENLPQLSPSGIIVPANEIVTPSVNPGDPNFAGPNKIDDDGGVTISDGAMLVNLSDPSDSYAIASWVYKYG